MGCVISGVWKFGIFEQSKIKEISTQTENLENHDDNFLRFQERGKGFYLKNKNRNKFFYCGFLLKSGTILWSISKKLKRSHTCAKFWTCILSFISR